jgi:alpha-ketoglutarate-dependent taurine dioxygenase
MHVTTITFANTPAFFVRLHKLTDTEDAILVRHLPLDNAVLVRLARRLGPLSSAGIGTNKAVVEDQYVHRISNSFSIADEQGYPIISTTSDAFPLHTDCFFHFAPIPFVILHCWIPSDGGGVTLLSSVDDIVGELSQSTIRHLQECFVYTPYGSVPLLLKDGHSYRIQYNRHHINKFSSFYNKEYSDHELGLFDLLDHVALRVSMCTALSKEDCLIINNQRCLHGRTAFPVTGSRLLKRILIDAWH